MDTSSRASLIRRATTVVGLAVLVALAVAPVLMLKPPAMDGRTALTRYSYELQGNPTDLNDAQLAAARRRINVIEDTGAVQVLTSSGDDEVCWKLTVVDGRPDGVPKLTQPVDCVGATPLEP